MPVFVPSAGKFLYLKGDRELMKNTLHRIFATLLALAMVFSLAACGSTGTTSGGSQAGTSNAGTGDGVVNIGCTSSIGSLNPILVDATWSSMYAISMSFLPLVALDENAEFENILADSITTEDNIHYTIHINDDATWSDGEPVTSTDLAFTMQRLASPVIANPAMMLYALVGTDDETGYIAEGADGVEGVQIVDDKTVEFTFKYEMNMTSFLNGYAQYIFVIPEHVLSEVPEEDFAAYDWFTHPDVVDGPYMATSFDSEHYVTYQANPSFWRGEVNIPYANIKVVDGAGLYAGLQSGEIDIVPPLLGTIDQEDYESVQALSNVTSSYGDAYSVENVFINTQIVDNVNIRQAMLYALDRTQFIDGLLGGEGDLADGFAVPDGPYWKDLTPTTADTAKAEELVAAAQAQGWDPNTTYTLYANSGETQLGYAIQLAQQAWESVGIHVDIQAVDLDTLMTLAGTEDAAMIAVQYTYPPVDPSWDIQYVLDSWCHALSDEVNTNLNTMWSTNDSGEYADALYAIDSYVQQNVPMIDLYINGPLGAVSNRLQGATPSMYGCLNHIETWTLAE